MKATRTTKKDQSIYQRNGYNSRSEYLKCLSLDYGVDYETVCMIADMNGPSEDFDGLLISLEDYVEMYNDDYLDCEFFAWGDDMYRIEYFTYPDTHILVHETDSLQTALEVFKRTKRKKDHRLILLDLDGKYAASKEPLNHLEKFPPLT